MRSSRVGGTLPAPGGLTAGRRGRRAPSCASRRVRWPRYRVRRGRSAGPVSGPPPGDSQFRILLGERPTWSLSASGFRTGWPPRRVEGWRHGTAAMTSDPASGGGRSFPRSGGRTLTGGAPTPTAASTSGDSQRHGVDVVVGHQVRPDPRMMRANFERHTRRGQHGLAVRVGIAPRRRRPGDRIPLVVRRQGDEDVRLRAAQVRPAGGHAGRRSSRRSRLGLRPAVGGRRPQHHHDRDVVAPAGLDRCRDQPVRNRLGVVAVEEGSGRSPGREALR